MCRRPVALNKVSLNPKSPIMSRAQKNRSIGPETAAIAPGGAARQARSPDASVDEPTRLDLDNGNVPAPVRRGTEIIRQFWEHAPAGPGVYRMIGADEVLYVGKAKSV